MNKVIVTVIVIMAVAVAAAIAAMLFLDNRARSPSQMMGDARQLMETGQHAQALEKFRAVLEVEPYNIQAFMGAADAFAEMGQVASAAQFLRDGLTQTGSPSIAWALVSLQPDVAQTYLDAAELLFQTGGGDTASIVLQSGFERTGDESIRLWLAELGISPGPGPAPTPAPEQEPGDEPGTESNREPEDEPEEPEEEPEEGPQEEPEEADGNGEEEEPEEEAEPPSTGQTAPAGGERMRVRSGVNVRQGPENDSEVIATLLEGDIVSVEARHGWPGTADAWLYVRLATDTRNVAGWVFSTFLEPAP